MSWLRLDERSATTSPAQPRKLPAGRSAAGLGSLTLGLGTLDAFAFNGADLTPDHRGGVAEIAGLLVGLLVKDPGGRVSVTGHTDLVGGEEVNLDLGRKRAVAVAAALHEAGVPLAALDVTSAGESAPVVATQGREPRNRRVEIRFAGAPIGTGAAGGLRLGVPAPPVTVPRPETFVPGGPGSGTLPPFGAPQKTPGTATPQPGQTPGRVDPGRAEPQARSGSAGDVAKAVAALPAVKKLLDDARARVARDADKLTTGDKVVLGTVGGSMAAAAIAGIASDPAARQGVLDLIDGQEIPVPGLRGVSVVPHTKGGGVGGGVSFDIVKIFGGSGR
ncbi:MAG TPA: OmpA family protein [Solirubrobacteraceae bacterium]